MTTQWPRPGAPACAMKKQVPGPGGALGLLMPRSRGLDQATIHPALSPGGRRGPGEALSIRDPEPPARRAQARAVC